MLGTLEREHTQQDASLIAERLLSAFPSMLMYWYHSQTTGKRIKTQTETRYIADHFLQLLHGKVDAQLKKSLNVSLILYAEHEFNVSTFTARAVASTYRIFILPLQLP